jgi:hypothetical protein
MFFGAGAWAPTKHVRGGQTVELRALKAALGGTGGGGGVCGVLRTGHAKPPLSGSGRACFIAGFRVSRMPVQPSSSVQVNVVIHDSRS